MAGRRLKPLPAQVFSILGPLTVSQADTLLDDEGKEDEDLLGCFNKHSRLIEVRTKDVSRVQTWHTLIHERVHACLWDAGVKLTHDQEEAVCDALATMLVAEMLAPALK